jgi:N-acetylmuramoyl-L-alanine amidase CwlA
MAKLTPDATRTEHGLVINEKIIPWGAVWPKDSGAYKKGAQYKADRLLSGGTGKVKGVTIHNTNDLKNVEEDAEQYTRATWPNANMNDARVHYYVDDINAWQNLREDEVGWHAGDGRKATGGNETTLSIEIIMDGSGSKEDLKAEENGVLLAALLLKKHGLSVNELYTHNHWMGHPDSIVQGARKNCPLYILPHWAQFKQKVAAKLAELNGGATTTETGKTEIMGKAKASVNGGATTTEAGKTEIMGKAKANAQQMALFARSKNAEPQLPACSLEQLAQFFLEEGEAEGVRGDVAFAQSLHETGFFKYGGIVLPTQNNYAGIGALNGNAKGQAATFPDPRTGVRAQIQHLKAYASKEALVNGCVDPRFSLVTRGSAQYVEWLGASDNPNGKGWAVPGKGYGGKVVALLGQIMALPGKGYGGKIVALLGQIMAFEVPQTSAPSEPEEQEPEFPAYQLEGLETLVEAGVINSPEFWRQKFSEQVTVGEMFGILGKLFTKVTE